MPTARAASALRTEVLDTLREHHEQVKKACREFQQLDANEGAEARATIVSHLLQVLSVHAALLGELLDPAAREASAENSLIDGAELEHESLRALVCQFRAVDPEDDDAAARYTVLCEELLLHLMEAEGRVLPQVNRDQMDQALLGARMAEVYAELRLADGESAMRPPARARSGNSPAHKSASSARDPSLD